jgi:hypothetical protein
MDHNRLLHSASFILIDFKRNDCRDGEDQLVVGVGRPDGCTDPLRRPCAWIVLADHVVDFAEFGQLALHWIIEDRQARHFDDAALDRIHKTEIGDNPGKQPTFGIARATQEERRRGYIVHGVDAGILDRRQMIEQPP